MAFQAAVIMLIVAGLFASGVLFDFKSVESTVEILREAAARDETGALVLRPTSDLKKLRTEVRDLWFVIRDRNGQRLSEGTVPPEYDRLGDALDHIGQARLGWNMLDPPRPTARIRWVTSGAGNVQVLTGPESQLPPRLIMLGISLIFLKEVLPTLLVMAIAALMVTPWVVRRALAGLDKAAAGAGQIELDKGSVRLPLDGVPLEAAPLVRAINAALGRIDRGHERHKRFLAAAAHELRTPVAILTTRVASLQASSDKIRLLEDAARLSTLTEQLLDLERLDQPSVQLLRVDLGALAQRVVADLAPLIFAAGYQVSFEAPHIAAMVSCDPHSIERALTNLIQNAIEHGGRAGTITVRVTDAPLIEVTDEGQGVPLEERDRVFEPFHRLQPKRRGLGLGLNLVQEIMHRHGGRATITTGLKGGACLTLLFPPSTAREQHEAAERAK